MPGHVWGFSLPNGAHHCVLTLRCCRCLSCSVSVLSENQDSALLVAAVGVQDSVHDNNRLQKFPGSSSAVESIIKSGTDYLTWSSTTGTTAPTDWAHLATSAGEGEGRDSCLPQLLRPRCPCTCTARSHMRPPA